MKLATPKANFCFVTLQKLSSWPRIFLELVSYGKFDFSRPDLDGKKPAKGKGIVRKARDIKK